MPRTGRDTVASIRKQSWARISRDAAPRGETCLPAGPMESRALRAAATQRKHAPTAHPRKRARTAAQVETWTWRHRVVYSKQRVFFHIQSQLAYRIGFCPKVAKFNAGGRKHNRSRACAFSASACPPRSRRATCHALVPAADAHTHGAAAAASWRACTNSDWSGENLSSGRKET